jgi:hypothetical protein
MKINVDSIWLSRIRFKMAATVRIQCSSTFSVFIDAFSAPNYILSCHHISYYSPLFLHLSFIILFVILFLTNSVPMSLL